MLLSQLVSAIKTLLTQGLNNETSMQSRYLLTNSYQAIMTVGMYVRYHFQRLDAYVVSLCVFAVFFAVSCVVLHQSSPLRRGSDAKEENFRIKGARGGGQCI